MTGPAPAGAATGTIPASVDALASSLIKLYADAETALVDAVTRAAARGFTDSSAVRQVAMLAEMRRAAERVAAALRLRSPGLVAKVAAEAAQRGDAAAHALLRRIVQADPALARFYLEAGGHPTAAANAIALDLTSRLRSTETGILRYADDAYRTAVAEASTRLVAGREGLTPATAQRAAWRELTRSGVTGFTDRRGRQWNLASYVEVATRTAVQRAYNTAHLDRMTAVGIRWFTISHDGRPCPLCKPWEGAVLSTGPTGLQVDQDARTGRPVAFRVAGTLDQARAAGLQHPNCEHVLLPYFPGVTKTGGTAKWSTADEQRYEATQQLRALERQVRVYKREQAAALDDTARLAAGRRIRETQAGIREHVDQHGLVRRRRREQLNLGNR